MQSIITWLFQKSKKIGILSLVVLFLTNTTLYANKLNKKEVLLYYYYLLAWYEVDEPNLSEEFLKKAIKLEPRSDFLKKNLIYFYLQNQKISEAENLAYKLYQQNPQDQENLLWLSKIYLMQNRPSKTIELLENYLEKHPKDEKILGFLINLYMEQKNWELALKNLDKLLTLDPQNFTAWLLKARILREQKNYEEAKIAYLKAFENSSTNRLILLEVVRFLDEISNFSEAEKLLKDYLTKNPEDKDFIRLLLSFYLERSAWEESEKLLKEFLEKYGTEEEFLFYLGLSLEGHQKGKEALEVYQKIPPTSPWFLEASKRIIGLLKKYEPEGAVNYLEKLANLNLQTKEFFLFLVNASEVLDLCEKGIEYGKKGLILFPDDLDLTLAVASNYACLNNYKKVLEIVTPLLQKFPEDPYVLNFIGYSYVELEKNLEEAETLLIKALNKKPEDPYILDSLGWLYYKKKNFDLALEYLEKAVKNLKEDDPVILEHLGDVLIKVKKDLKRACELYQRAIKVVIHQKDKERIEKKLQNCSSP